MADITPNGPGNSGYNIVPLRGQPVSRPLPPRSTSPVRRPTRAVGGGKRAGSAGRSGLGGNDLHSGRSEEIEDESPIDSARLLFAQKSAHPDLDTISRSSWLTKQLGMLVQRGFLSIWPKDMADRFSWAASPVKSFMYRTALAMGIVSLTAWGGYRAGE